MKEADDDPMLLEVTGLKKYFPAGGGVFSTASGWVRAVDGVSLSLSRGETLGLVGESGCGKTTVGKSILRLEEPTGGDVRFDGVSLMGLEGEALRRMRRRMQIVFQDPISSLDPRMTVGGIIGEPLRVHGVARGREVRSRVADLLDRVELAREASDRYPHEFSGGQRQRMGIARALALSPELVICDEPVSSLDVSIQAQIINLLLSLQEEMGLSYLFISHDLGVVKYVSDRVAVMYLGKIVEEAISEDLYGNPLHPYTRALLASVPEVGRAAFEARGKIVGEVASSLAPPPGCRFHPRCPSRMEICEVREPELKEIGPEHRAACWLY